MYAAIHFGYRSVASAFLSWSAWVPILYAGIMSCGVGYTLQIIGQNGLNPTVASLIMSLEAVFSGGIWLADSWAEAEYKGDTGMLSDFFGDHFSAAAGTAKSKICR